MYYVARHTSIPVPRIYEVFLARRSQKNNVLHLIMEFVPGMELGQAWPLMSVEERRAIMRQLQVFLAKLRRLKPQCPGAIESIYGQPCQSPLIRGNSPFGPFSSVKAFQRFLGSEYVQEHSKNHREKAELDRTASCTYTTVFTHGDLAPQNILVRDGKIVAIVDWESGGWYPKYWEYTRTYMSNMRHPEFWEMFRTDALEVVYPDELAMDSATADMFFQG